MGTQAFYLSFCFVLKDLNTGFLCCAEIFVAMYGFQFHSASLLINLKVLLLTVFLILKLYYLGASLLEELKTSIHCYTVLFRFLRKVSQLETLLTVI